MENFTEELKKYFAETPPEKVLEDWEKTKEWDNVAGGSNKLTSKEEFIKRVATIHSQNLSGREDFIEAFEIGIGVAYDEMMEMVNNQIKFTPKINTD